MRDFDDESRPLLAPEENVLIMGTISYPESPLLNYDEMKKARERFMRNGFFEILLLIVGYLFDPYDLCALSVTNRLWHDVVDSTEEFQEWKKITLFLKGLEWDTKVYEPKNKGNFFRAHGIFYHYITELNAGFNANQVLSLFPNRQFSLKKLLEFYQKPYEQTSPLSQLKDILSNAQESGVWGYRSINAAFKRSAGKKRITTFLLKILGMAVLLAGITSSTKTTVDLCIVAYSQNRNSSAESVVIAGTIICVLGIVIPLYWVVRCVLSMARNKMEESHEWKKVPGGTIANAERFFKSKSSLEVIPHAVLETRIENRPTY